MARGTLSGFVAGTVVSGLVAGAASVMTEVPGAGAPEATALEVPAGSEFDQSRDDTEAALPEVQESPDAADVAKVEAPEPDDLSTIDSDATVSADQPETGQTDLALAAPETGDSAVGVEVDSDSPVLPSPQANAPEAPMSEEELSISTEPAQPVQPEVSDEETAFPSEAEAPEGAAPAADEAGDNTATEEAAEEPAVSDEPEAMAQDDAGSAAPESAEEETASAAPEQAETADAGEATEESAEESAAVDVQDEITAPQQPALSAPEAAPDVTPEAETATPEPAAPEPAEEDVAALPEAEAPSGTIDNIARNVTTGRLPSVGAAPEPAEDPAAGEEAPGEQTAAVDNSDLPPLQRYAAEFENPDGKPLMSIVLIDDGSSPIGLDALNSFPYPLSFAVDTGWDGAQDAMETYRAAGFEVLALVDLPEAAEASDIEVAMEAYLARVPQAVAVMEGDGTGLQSSREASEQLAKILRDTGHGAVMFPNGLNTAQKLIAREGVPSASVFRDFDAKGQNATVIRRFLDQAAFKAGQEDQGVIMVGRLRADTISALLLWGLQDRASRVAVAPVSQVLTAE